MQSVLFYVLGFGAFTVVSGGVIAFFALRNAPEGFEDETGFVGLTKGDEALLREFGRGERYNPVHGSVDMVA
jgi:hypothetical protein